MSAKNHLSIISYSFFLLYFLTSTQIYPQDQQITDLVDSLSIENIEDHIKELCWAGGYQTRVTFTQGNYEAANYIAEYFESLPGISSVERDTFKIVPSLYPYSTYPVINVIATIDGSSSDPQIILTGAHYDASGSREGNYDNNWKTIKAQGADDNATGVASIMEIARVLSDTNNSFDNLHTIKFVAFGAEEGHPTYSTVSHAGSMRDAKNMRDSNAPLAAAIILDMIGYNPSYNYTEVISNQESMWLADHVYKSTQFYTPWLLTNDTPSDVPYSDHDSYQEYGFSAILLMENDKPWNNDSPYYVKNPHYHTSADTIETLNLPQVEEVAKLALASISELSIKSDPTSVDINSDQVSFVPEHFNISAYPNPFNSKVNIIFKLNKRETVTIKVYNSLGQEVGMLINNQNFQQGVHRVNWQADNVPSGVYYCIIKNEIAMNTLKLLLLK
ncbi:M28 family peptidase [Bacteroidota bacterium]